jgi:hypothetical protein
VSLQRTGILLLAVVLTGCGGGGGGTTPPPPSNPVPTLTSLSPTSAAVGGAAFTLTVNGSKFISSSVVRWGGQNRTTTYVSSTQLTAAISATDIATTGTVKVTVFNPSPGGGTSNSLDFTITGGPTISSLQPASAFAGGPTFDLTVNGANFIDTSVVRWNGSDRTTTFSSSTMLIASILESDIASPGSASVTVFNPGPGGGESSPFNYSILNPAPLVITTSSLPDTTGGKTYDVTLASTGGIPPISWSINAGNLPQNLMLDPTTGRISGLVSAGPSTETFTVQASDWAASPHTATRDLSITVKSGPLGDNNTCTAGTTAGTTPISNGRIRASISPYGDIDVYSFQGTKDAEVTIEIFAQRLDLDNDPTTRDSYLDSIIELLNSSCSPIAVNDDINPGVVQDSRISVSSIPFPPACSYTPCGDIPPPTSLPYTGTYYIRVRDFRGDGRPDLIYELSLSGAQ